MDEHDSPCPAPVLPLPDVVCTPAPSAACLTHLIPAVVPPVPPGLSVGASLPSVHPPSDSPQAACNPPPAVSHPLSSVGAPASLLHPPPDAQDLVAGPMHSVDASVDDSVVAHDLDVSQSSGAASALESAPPPLLGQPAPAQNAVSGELLHPSGVMCSPSVHAELAASSLAALAGLPASPSPSLPASPASPPATPKAVPKPSPLSSGSPGSFPLVSAAPCPASCQPVVPSRNIPRWLDGSLNPAYRPPGLVTAAVVPEPAIPNPPKRLFRAPAPTLIPPLPARKLRARSLPALTPPGPASVAVTPCAKPAADTRKLTAPLPRTFHGSVPTAAPSIMCAFEAARDKLVARWLLFVNLLASFSALFVEASASSDPDFFISRVVITNAPSTLQRYLDMWAAWCLHCEIPRSSAHDPQPGVLPDWLRARSSPQGLATMPFKALSWFSRKAGLPLLRRQLEGAIARAFLSPSAPLEHRESLPFSLSFHGLVGGPRSLPGHGDLLWVPPARLQNLAPSAALVGICIRAKTTKSGMPWGIYSPGLLGSATSSWTTRWLSVVKQVLADTVALHPHRVIDFLPAILSADAGHPVIVKPLFRDQAVPWIRSLLCHHWNLHSSEPMPSVFNLIAIIGCQVFDKSVALYSRDDIGPMLCCQRTVVSCIRAGFRPLQPLARGSDHPLLDFPTELPSAAGLPRVRWSAAPEAEHTGSHSAPGTPVHPAAAATPLVPFAQDPDLPLLPDLLPDYNRAPTPPVSSCSSENDCGSVCSEPPSDPEALEVECAAVLQPPSPSSAPALLLYNSCSNVTHTASSCDPDAPRALFQPTFVGSARRVARKQTNSTRRVWSNNRRPLAPCASVRRAPNVMLELLCFSASVPCAMESVPSTPTTDRSVFSVRTERRRVQLPGPDGVEPAHLQAVPAPVQHASPPVVRTVSTAYLPGGSGALWPDPSWSDAQLSSWLSRLDHRVVVRLRILLQARDAGAAEVILGYCQQPCSNRCGNLCGRPMLDRPRPHRDHFCGRCHAARRASETLDIRHDMPPVLRRHRRRQGGAMAHRPRLDDPSVLEALLTQYSAPDDLAAKLKSAGYNALSALVFAAPEVADEPQLLRSLLSLPAPSELTTPACSAVRRLLMEARLLLPGVPPASTATTSASPSAPLLPQPAVPRLTSAELSQLRTDFTTAYPGELLDSATTPCLEMCSAIKHLHDSSCSPWLPWRQRASEADRAAWSESRAWSDLRRGPQWAAESVLRRNLSLFATALAMTKITHLITIKRFTDKFISTALAVPLDPSLRPPTLNEILAADRAVWVSIHELVRDHAWSIEDALNEISTCRQDISALLQPRPRPAKAAAGKGRGKEKTDGTSAVPGFEEPARPTPPGVCEQPVLHRSLPSQPSMPCPPPHAPARSVAPSVREQPAAASCADSAFPSRHFLPACLVVPGIREQPASDLPSLSLAPRASQDCPGPHCRPIPGVCMFLDLFAGSSAPVHNAIRKLLLARMEPVDLLTGSALDVSDDVTYSALCRLCASGLIGACCAAPPCSAYSRARLAKPGPPPVRTPSFPLGLPNLSPKQQRELAMSTLLHQRTRHLLSLVAARGGIIFLENPSTSLLWLDPQVMAWVRAFAPFGASVASCAHGLDYKKAWLFWCNRPSVAALASVCPHLPAYHRPLSRQRTADGGFLTRTTACCRPPSPAPLHPSASPSCQLRTAIIHCLHGLTCCPPFPVEDGAGTGSAACHVRPQSDDHFKALRRAWSARLAHTGLVPKIVTALSSGAKTAPLSEDELAPLFLDLREFLQVHQEELRAGWILEVPGGDAELKRRYEHTAVGKLGVVLSEGRPPRLVVDSSISGVTEATHLPNRSANPTLLDIRRCLPISDARERLVALVLDVSKAHRRLKTLPADQGLLCFRHRGRLYQCKTLNFGACASGFYWARVAGLLVRLVHRFWWVGHSALIYVDDQYCPPLVHVALSVQAWARLQSVLSNDLRVIGPSGLASAPLGSRVFRVAQTAVLTKEELPQFPPSARRLWVQISDLAHPDRVISDASRAVMDMWLQICRSGTDFKSLLLSPHFECEAFADARADGSSAGLGGFVRLPGGQTLFFQVTFSQAELHSLNDLADGLSRGYVSDSVDLADFRCMLPLRGKLSGVEGQTQQDWASSSKGVRGASSARFEECIRILQEFRVERTLRFFHLDKITMFAWVTLRSYAERADPLLFLSVDPEFPPSFGGHDSSTFTHWLEDIAGNHYATAKGLGPEGGILRLVNMRKFASEELNAVLSLHCSYLIAFDLLFWEHLRSRSICPTGSGLPPARVAGRLGSPQTQDELEFCSGFGRCDKHGECQCDSKHAGPACEHDKIEILRNDNFHFQVSAGHYQYFRVHVPPRFPGGYVKVEISGSAPLVVLVRYDDLPTKASYDLSNFDDWINHRSHTVLKFKVEASGGVGAPGGPPAFDGPESFGLGGRPPAVGDGMEAGPTLPRRTQATGSMGNASLRQLSGVGCPEAPKLTHPACLAPAYLHCEDACMKCLQCAQSADKTACSIPCQDCSHRRCSQSLAACASDISHFLTALWQRIALPMHSLRGGVCIPRAFRVLDRRRGTYLSEYCTIADTEWTGRIFDDYRDITSNVQWVHSKSLVFYETGFDSHDVTGRKYMSRYFSAALQ
ncbi:unnamed protein product [Symbiodinium natans]|uniref:Uncharacterized protein n=1 Tax=Symbiodinium natans TaxID=878477 RepID=A0A812KD76_9DINO|nr:unnamed protein product [Symbiodinium natans]